ncbi:MAG: hypothetical protein H7X80_09625, partial [bacterium]|nr:hypothetical protein [Candidatus Kapabacteria bacterium]
MQLPFRITTNVLTAVLIMVLVSVCSLHAQMRETEGMDAAHVQPINLAASGSNLIVSTIRGGTYRSSDGGTTWIPTPGLPQQYTNFAYDGSTIFAGQAEDYDVNNGVYVSTDAGATWVRRTSGLVSASQYITM